jgi:hypothetical protein
MSVGINLASSRSAPTPHLSANFLSPTSREFQALLAMYCAGLAWCVFLFACVHYGCCSHHIMGARHKIPAFLTLSRSPTFKPKFSFPYISILSDSDRSVLRGARLVFFFLRLFTLWLGVMISYNPSLRISLGFRAAFSGPAWNIKQVYFRPQLDFLRWSLSPGSSSVHYAQLGRRRQKVTLPTLIIFHSSADSTDPEIDFGPGT